MAFIDAHDPRSRIDLLLIVEGTSGVESALDVLYQTTLKSVEMWDDEAFTDDFRAILGLILVARAPLSTGAIDALRGISDLRPSNHTISRLRCVLAQTPTVRVLHPSFADFLSNRVRSGRDIWFIELTSHNDQLAIMCLCRLDIVLQRNMCDLTVFSEERGCLSEDVAYACVFWIEHVCRITHDLASIAARAYAFLRRLLNLFQVSFDSFFILSQCLIFRKVTG